MIKYNVVFKGNECSVCKDKIILVNGKTHYRTGCKSMIIGLGNTYIFVCIYSILPSYQHFSLLQLQLPTVSCGVKILSGKFQKETIFKFSITHCSA